MRCYKPIVGGYMEKNRNAQVIAIIVLVVGVVGLSIGFASFSSVLNIQASANVKPDSSTMNVDFSSAIDKVEVNEIVPTAEPTSLTTTNATIDNSVDPTISNLSATFTELGQSVVYKFYAYNAGELNANLYLAENTNFDGYWLKTPRFTPANYSWFFYVTARRVHSAPAIKNDILGVRPVIEVYNSDIYY